MVAGIYLSNMVICNISRITREEKIIENLIPKMLIPNNFWQSFFVCHFGVK